MVLRQRKGRVVVRFNPWVSDTNQSVDVVFNEKGGGWAPAYLMGKLFSLRGDWYSLIPIAGQRATAQYLQNYCLQPSDLKRRTASLAICQSLAAAVSP